MGESHRRVRIKGATGRASRDTVKGKPWGVENERECEFWIIPPPWTTNRSPDNTQRLGLVAVQLKWMVNQLLIHRDRQKQKQGVYTGFPVVRGLQQAQRERERCDQRWLRPKVAVSCWHILEEDFKGCLVQQLRRCSPWRWDKWGTDKSSLSQ